MVNVNNGGQNNPGHPPSGRSILDYSLIACFTLILLLGILVLDAFEYITVPGMKGGSKGATHSALESVAGVDILSNEELAELQQKIDEAKKSIAAKHDEVEKIVNKVETEIKAEEEAEKPADEPAKVETPEEKKEEEEKKEVVVEAIVQKELGIDRFCGGCQWGGMPFTCNKRLDWMMEAYGLSEDIAKEAIINKCHTRLRRGRA